MPSQPPKHRNFCKTSAGQLSPSMANHASDHWIPANCTGLEAGRRSHRQIVPEQRALTRNPVIPDHSGSSSNESVGLRETELSTREPRTKSLCILSSTDASGYRIARLHQERHQYIGQLTIHVVPKCLSSGRAADEAIRGGQAALRLFRLLLAVVRGETVCTARPSSRAGETSR